MSSGRSGLYSNYYAHKRACIHCSPNQEQTIHERNEAEKENRISNILKEDEGHIVHPVHRGVHICSLQRSYPYILSMCLL